MTGRPNGSTQAGKKMSDVASPTQHAMTPAASRIYLDNAATSWPKVESVYQAVEYQLRTVGAAAGRGAHQGAAEAAAVVQNCRRRIAHWLGAETPDAIVLTHNGTAALNLALHGVLQPGDHVVTTVTEHNSVLRPLADLEERLGVRWECVGCDRQGRIAVDELLAAVRPETKLVAVSHASNVTGVVQPIAEIGAALKGTDVLFLCDAAQTLGYLPIDVGAAAIDLLAAPGHKGAGGPLGTGILYVGPRAANAIRPTVQGGTGGESDRLTMPIALPHRLEAGNLNVPAIAGLLAGVEWLTENPGRESMQRLAGLAERLHSGLRAIENIQFWMGGDGLPIASFVLSGMEPGDVAAVLDAEFGIQVRSGLHCAAKIHAFLGSEPSGTVRISAGHQTSEAEVDAVVRAVAEIAAAAVVGQDLS